MAEGKFCIGCRHFRNGAICAHPSYGFEPVLGAQIKKSAHASRAADGACKTFGHLWEPRTLLQVIDGGKE